MEANSIAVKIKQEEESRNMTIILWILQLLLALVFAFHGGFMLMPPADMVAMINEQLGQNFRIFLGAAEVLAAIGLILPGITRIFPWLISITAACLAFVMASATVLHISRGETSSAITTAVLLVLSLLLAYLRWRVKPILPRAA